MRQTDSGHAIRHHFNSIDFVLGIALIVFAFFYRYYSIDHTGILPLYGDMVHYNAAAHGILIHHIFSFWGGRAPDAYVTPGYPLFLALCYLIAESFTKSAAGQIYFVILVQTVLAAFTAGGLFWICRRGVNRLLAVLVAAAWICYPPTIFSVTLILTETLYVFFLIFYALSFIVAMERKTWYWWLCTGVLLGLCGLVRPTVFPLVLAPLLWMVVRLRRADSPFSLAVSFVAHGIGFVAVLLPWWIRNFRIFHKLVLSDTEVGNPLLFGSDPAFPHNRLLGHGLTETAQQQLAIHRIVFGFSHHPWLYLKWYTVGKLNDLFDKPWFHPLTKTTSSSTLIWFQVHPYIVVIGAVGLVLGLWYAQMRFISLLAIFLVAVQLPFIPVNRYAFPVIPLLMIGAGYVLQVLWNLLLYPIRGRVVHE